MIDAEQRRYAPGLDISLRRLMGIGALIVTRHGQSMSLGLEGGRDESDSSCVVGDDK